MNNDVLFEKNLPVFIALNAKRFEEWWDPKKIPPSIGWAIVRYCSDKFDIWWKSGRIPVEGNRYEFTRYCSKNFEKWYTPEAFPPSKMFWLALYCPEHFDLWWDPDRYPPEDARFLAMGCLDHYKKWSKYMKISAIRKHCGKDNTNTMAFA